MPQKKWDEQQQAQQTARRDQAGEVSARSSEVTSTADILVSRLLDVISLASAHVSQCTLTATPAANTTSCAVLALSNAATAIACSSTIRAPVRSACSGCSGPVGSAACHCAAHPSAAIAAVHHGCR